LPDFNPTAIECFRASGAPENWNIWLGAAYVPEARQFLAGSSSKGQTMGHSDQGIAKTGKGEEQPKDKQRAQTVHTVAPDKSVSHEATGDAQASDGNARNGSQRDRKV
jgi:hypothetical protein